MHTFPALAGQALELRQGSPRAPHGRSARAAQRGARTPSLTAASLQLRSSTSAWPYATLHTCGSAAQPAGLGGLPGLRAGSGSMQARQACSRPRQQPSGAAGSQQSSARQRSAESTAGARSGRPRLEPPCAAAPACGPPALPRSRRRGQRARPPTAYSSRLSACLRARSRAAATHAWVRAVWRAPDRCSRAAEAAASRHRTGCSPGNRLGRLHCQAPSLSGECWRCSAPNFAGERGAGAGFAAGKLCTLRQCQCLPINNGSWDQHCTTPLPLHVYSSARPTTWAPQDPDNYRPAKQGNQLGHQTVQNQILYTRLVRQQVQGTCICTPGCMHHSASARAAPPPSAAWAASRRASARCRRHAGSGKGLQVCGGRIAWAHARAAARSSCCVSHMRTACAAPRPRVGASSRTA